MDYTRTELHALLSSFCADDPAIDPAMRADIQRALHYIDTPETIAIIMRYSGCSYQDIAIAHLTRKPRKSHGSGKRLVEKALAHMLRIMNGQEIPPDDGHPIYTRESIKEAATHATSVDGATTER